MISDGLLVLITVYVLDSFSEHNTQHIHHESETCKEGDNDSHRWEMLRLSRGCV